MPACSLFIVVAGDRSLNKKSHSVVLMLLCVVYQQDRNSMGPGRKPYWVGESDDRDFAYIPYVTRRSTATYTCTVVNQTFLYGCYLKHAQH